MQSLTFSGCAACSGAGIVVLIQLAACGCGMAFVAGQMIDLTESQYSKMMARFFYFFNERLPYA